MQTQELRQLPGLCCKDAALARLHCGPVRFCKDLVSVLQRDFGRIFSGGTPSILGSGHAEVGVFRQRAGPNMQDPEYQQSRPQLNLITDLFVSNMA